MCSRKILIPLALTVLAFVFLAGCTNAASGSSANQSGEAYIGTWIFQKTESDFATIVTNSVETLTITASAYEMIDTAVQRLPWRCLFQSTRS